MYTLIVICVLMVQLSICKRKYKYFLTPPFILTLLWLLVHVLNLLCGWQTNEKEYLILVLPPVMFALGFGMIVNRRFVFGSGSTYHKQLSCEIMDSFSIEYRRLYIILIIDFVLMVLSLRSAMEVVAKLSNANFWLNIHDSASLVENNIIMTYSVPMAYIFSAFCGILFNSKKNAKNLIIYLLALLIAIIRAFLAGNRTALLMVIIINLFSVLLSVRKNNGINTVKSKRKTRKLIIFAGIMAAVMFFGIASQKYNDQFASLSMGEFIFQNFTGYFNLSSAAFVKWYKQGYNYTYGANTFRFFFAILERMGITVQVSDTNAQFIAVEGTVTNAFTVAKPYVEDFGIGFMAIMLMFWGMLHAHFYKKAFDKDLYKRFSGLLFCSVLYIGLLSQILGEQYVLILSMLINFYIWSIVFSKLLIKRKKDS